MNSFSEMEWNARWDRDKTAMYNSKANESVKKLQLTDWAVKDEGEIDAGSFNLSGCGNGSGGSGSDFAHSSSVKSSVSASTDSSPKERMRGLTFEAFEGSPSPGAIVKKTQPVRVELSGSSSPLEASVVSVEPLIGLKLGYYENNRAGSNSKSFSPVVPVSSTVGLKKTKASCQNETIPRCQVEGCNLDLSSSKEYHRKHRVCDSHSKCPKVVVGGLERRFCQQCSRFHSLQEFDEKKRSCRRRLSDHNARRRKPRQETIQFHSTKLSSSLHDGRQEMNFLLNNAKYTGNSAWENICSSKFTLTKGIPLKSENTGLPYLPSIELPYGMTTHCNSSNGILESKGTAAEVFTEGLKETAFSSNLDAAPEFPRALSLLSTTYWGSSEPESLSFDHPLPTNPAAISLPVMHAIPQGLPLGTSDFWQIEQQSTNPHLHNFSCSSSSGGQFQEIQLFKPQYENDIYSNALN